MQSEQQQRIMGYFIEEAKDHLNTIEQGLLNLQGTIEDPDLVSEVFRAAHSVKGGAAMLGLDSIQQTAHRLEDYFKVLKECPVQVDQKLESLFLRVFDTLQDLVEQLQGPFGLTSDSASQIMADVEPVMSQLNSHLSQLVKASGQAPPDEVDLTHTVEAPTPASTSAKAVAPPSKPEDSALQLYFQSDVPAQLRAMLQLFKQPDTDAVRQQLQEICTDFGQAGESFDLPQSWSHLAVLAQRAIANPDNDFRSLAPALIKDFKQAQDLVLAGNAEDIQPSAALQEMQPLTDVLEEDAPVLSSEEVMDDMTDFLSIDSDTTGTEVSDDRLFDDDALASLGELDQDNLLDESVSDVNLFGESFDGLALESDDLGLDDFSPDSSESASSEPDHLDVDNLGLDDLGLDSLDSEELTPSKTESTVDDGNQGPQVGTAELNSLADLFENEAPELGMDWKEEVIDDASDMMVEGLALDASNDFSDLLFDEASSFQSKSHQHEADDISGIMSDLNESSPLASAAQSEDSDEFSDLFAIGRDDQSTLTPSSGTELSDNQSSDGLDGIGDFFEPDADSALGESLAASTDLPGDVDADLDLSDILVEDASHSAEEQQDDLLSLELDVDSFSEDDGLPDFSSDASKTDDIDELLSDPSEPDVLELGAFDSDASIPESSEEAIAPSDDLELEDLWDSTPSTAGEDTSSDDDLDLDLAALDEVTADSDSTEEASDDLDQLLADEFSDDIDHFLGISEDAVPSNSDLFAEGGDEFDEFMTDRSAQGDIHDPALTDTDEPDLDLDFNLDDELGGTDSAASSEDLIDTSSEASDLIEDSNAFLDTLMEDGASADEGEIDLDFDFENVDTSPEGESSMDSWLHETAPETEAVSVESSTSQDSSDLSSEDISSEDIDALFDNDSPLGDSNLDLSDDVSSEITQNLPDDLLDGLSDELDTSDASSELLGLDSSEVAVSEVAADDDRLSGDSDALGDLDNLEVTNDSAADVQDAFNELDQLDLEDDDSGAEEEVIYEDAELDLEGFDDLDLEVEEDIDGALISEIDSALDLEDSSSEELPDHLGLDFDLDAAEQSDQTNQIDSGALENVTDSLGIDEMTDSQDFTDVQSDETSDTNVVDTLLDESALEAEAMEASITEQSALDGFDDLDSLLDDADLDTEDSEDGEAFDELDNLLDDKSIASPEEENEFDDLDALLVDNSVSSSNGEALDSNGHQMGTSTDNGAFDASFDDLEALLDTPSASNVTSFSAKAASVEPSASEDDFSDLEKLLKDANQTLAAPSAASSSRGKAPVPSRRPVRRGGGGFTDQTMRVSVKNLDNLNNLVGELVVNRNSLEQSQERLRQFLDNLLYQVQQLSDVGQRMRDLYERSLLESSLLSSRRSYQLANQAGGEMVGTEDSTHATGASFDALEMDRFTGFHTLSQEMIELIVRVREAASDIDFVIDESDQTTRMFRQVTTQLQEGLTRSRMVPFAQAAGRLPRAVRDISIKCGKQAELQVEGKDTLIDKMILEQLYDPMTHLVNNAITHGIETPEERHALNKPPVGKITIRVFHQGNQTIISVTDDGAGIDPEIVKAKALKKGLISEAEAAEMSRLDIYDLLFHHGFSTRDQADDFAGRGVGMDVVRTSLNEIRGVINIDSTIGQGTTFTIRLPLTLSISKALLCVSNRARIAFPMDGVEDMLDVPSDRIQTNEENKPCIYWRDIVLPFYPLSELLKYNRMLGRGSVYGGSQEDDVISVVVLRSAGNYLALQVDQVLGEQEIVIKQLEAPIPKPAGIAGATVLGDGRIMPIADVLELIDLSMGRIRKEVGSSLWDQEAARIASVDAVEMKSEPTVLIVDDSITVRELLSMTFNKVGYRVEQARDGQEAWEKLKSGLPCELVFCDIEMPRMDGLELLSRLQKDPNLKGLPIAMLTSRGADRHRQMAVQLGAKGYFTKPYLEEVLLDAAQRMLNGEVLIGNG
jgi:chemosensory pili system protein ChpA (sensor histidine kinase/response regulator)